MMNRTLGQMWVPFMTGESSLEFYSPKVFQSMKLIYKEAGIFEGITTFRFKASLTPYVPMGPSTDPAKASAWTWTLESRCRHLQVQWALVSLSSFYNAYPVLAEAVIGLHPSEKEHSLSKALDKQARSSQWSCH